MANVSATGRINKHSLLLVAAGYLCVNFEIRGAGPQLSKHRRHRNECLFIRHRYPIQGYWVCQNDFDERGARVLTHGRVCSVRDIGHPSIIEMSVYLSDTGIGQNTFETKSPTKFASIHHVNKTTRNNEVKALCRMLLRTCAQLEPEGTCWKSALRCDRFLWGVFIGGFLCLGPWGAGG